MITMKLPYNYPKFKKVLRRYNAINFRHRVPECIVVGGNKKLQVVYIQVSF